MKAEIESEHNNWIQYSKAQRELYERSDDESQTKQSKSLFSSFFGSDSSNTQTETQKPDGQTNQLKKVKGLYLYGEPGKALILTIKIMLFRERKDISDGHVL